MGLKVGIVGLGAAGSFAMRALARRGIDVTGFEQFGIGNDRGASAGETRQFRVLYGEGAFYVGMLIEARRLWEAMEQECGKELFVKCGSLAIGDPDSAWIRSLVDCGREWELDHSVLKPAEMERRFPQFRRLEPSQVAVFDPLGGIIRSNESILHAVRDAASLGAEVLSWTHVTGIRETASAVEVSTSEGDFSFDQLIVSTGPWAKDFVPRAPVTIKPALYSLHHSLDSTHSAEGFPTSMFMKDGQLVAATQPMPDGHLVKYMSDTRDKAVDEVTCLSLLSSSRLFAPDDFSRRVSQEVGAVLNGVSPDPARAFRNFEGYSADNVPLIGRARDGSRLLMSIGWSGHGFKLAPVFGEMLADLVCGVDNPVAAHFDPARFGVSLPC